VLQRGDVAATAGGAGGLLELINIYGQAVVGAEPYHIVTECDRSAAQRAPDAVHELVQVVGRQLRLGIWPQPVHHQVAMQPMAGCKGEQLHQCLGLAQPPPIWHPLSVDHDREITQQRDLNLAGGRSRDRHGNPQRVVLKFGVDPKTILCTAAKPRRSPS
jgi:hypothetical protein